jgi:ABC-2 type transport system ATP-binding protein
VRLGFAVAVHVDPDILLVDEVLAVGDEAFQVKCLDKIAEFQEQNRTILVVSHALDLVARICDRAIVLDHGSLVFDGDPEVAADTLRMLLGTTPGDEEEVSIEAPANPVQVISATALDARTGHELATAHAGEPLVIRVVVDIEAEAVARCAELTIVLMGVGDLPILVQTYRGRPVGIAGGGRWIVDFRSDELPPLRGAVVVAVQVSDAEGLPVAVFRTKRGFAMVRDTAEPGLAYASYTTSARTEARALVAESRP